MKKYNLLIIIFFILWVGLAVVFSFTDLQISQVIYNPESGWAIFLQNYGQIPGILVMTLSLNLLLRLQSRNTLKNNLFRIILGGLILISGIFLGGELQGQQAGLRPSYLISLIISVVFFIGVQTWFKMTPEDQIRKFEKPAIVAILLVIFSSLITTWFFKILWGRWTYRDILSDGNLGLYTAWFLPQGPNGHHAFPSGHTSFALVVLPLLLLIPKTSQWKVPAWLLILLWGAAVAASRVVIGAHYASDVLFGGCQTILWYWMITSRIVKE